VTLRVGILGCGFIGTTIAGSLQDMEGVESIPLYDRDYDITAELAGKIRNAAVFSPDEMDGFIESSDIIVEAASQEAVREVLPQVVSMGKDVMILSVGALVDDELWDLIKKTARKMKCRVLIPSGAIAGMDGINSGSIADIDCITLTVRKPPSGLSLPRELSHLSDHIKTSKGPVPIFEGSAREAVSLFPKNVNVAATISLAGIGFDRTKVKVIADPTVTRNQHQVEVRGRFGEMRIRMFNQPSTTNPRTSYMAPLSAIATLKKLITGIHIGN
jgi:aspartate dehydrogenase